MYGIYIHVPFCLRKCPYCDFYSLAVSPSGKEEYLDALCRHIESSAPVAADTVYFGGGTPSLLEPGEIGRILSAVRSRHSLDPGAEVTMECNPATADREKFRGFLEAGVNRLSLGCQSFSGRCLPALGRLHSAEDSVKAVTDARDAGFSNISVDIMLGIPYEDPETAASDARAAADLGVQHVSAYLLRICEGTPFADGVDGVPDDDVQAECYRQFCSVMDSSGYEQYEISNFAKPGYRSRHNLKYWQCGQWLGLGPAAHSSDGRRRYSYPADLQRYISDFGGGCVIDPLSLMTYEGGVDAEEYIITSLRTSDGLDRAVLRDRFGLELDARQESFLRRCADAGLASVTPERVSLTRDGFLVSNSIISEVI